MATPKSGMKGPAAMREDVSIRPETPKDYRQVVSLVLRSFREGTTYSDGTDIIALIEEIRGSKYHIPELSFISWTILYSRINSLSISAKLSMAG